VPGVLLDTHALYWLVSGVEALTNDALVAIGESQDQGSLFVSPITAWELSIAAQKPPAAGRPHLGTDPPAKWFREAVRATAARVVPIQQRIALEAAKVVTETGHKDPGDCYLIATARIRKVPLITRDAVMLDLATRRPAFLRIVQC
jgi:PIN domain nuclease of toxin-antitoxin system